MYLTAAAVLIGGFIRNAQTVQRPVASVLSWNAVVLDIGSLVGRPTVIYLRLLDVAIVMEVKSAHPSKANTVAIDECYDPVGSIFMWLPR